MLSSETYWKESVWMFCKSLLPFLTFVNCEGPYLVEGFLRNLCPCFDIVFAPLGLITRTSNNIVEIAVTSECFLIIKIVGNYIRKLANIRISFLVFYTFGIYRKLARSGSRHSECSNRTEVT